MVLARRRNACTWIVSYLKRLMPDDIDVPVLTERENIQVVRTLLFSTLKIRFL
jgi:hypothetical protein